MRWLANSHTRIAAAFLLPATLLFAANSDKNFHNAPAAAQAMKNPYEGQAAAAQAGKRLYARNCLSCHGRRGEGAGNVPSLVDGKLETATPGEVFWFITKGDKDNGMPSWAQLPAKQRWQIVTFVKSWGLPQIALVAGGVASESSGSGVHYISTLKDPPPTPPFTDFRYEKPGTFRKITANDLPKPYATRSASNGPEVVARPENVWPVAPPGFKVELYAAGLDNPRNSAHGSERRHFSYGKRCRTHPNLSRNDQRWETRVVSRVRR